MACLYLYYTETHHHLTTTLWSKCFCHFTDKKNEVQRQQKIHPKPHNREKLTWFLPWSRSFCQVHSEAAVWELSHKNVNPLSLEAMHIATPLAATSRDFHVLFVFFGSSLCKRFIISKVMHVCYWKGGTVRHLIGDFLCNWELNTKDHTVTCPIIHSTSN